MRSTIQRGSKTRVLNSRKRSAMQGEFLQLLPHSGPVPSSNFSGTVISGACPVCQQHRPGTLHMSGDGRSIWLYHLSNGSLLLAVSGPNGEEPTGDDVTRFTSSLK